ncbi:hypothetical protein TWF481_002001 [Arthrobotrys musiformis]|uniref:Uncharacterized protein n=1 Tax=Arthrobotrys musiformis TaxID=47236 RepID=A0AAV9VWQ6_9PEZI
MKLVFGALEGSQLLRNGDEDGDEDEDADEDADEDDRSRLRLEFRGLPWFAFGLVTKPQRGMAGWLAGCWRWAGWNFDLS